MKRNPENSTNAENKQRRSNYTGFSEYMGVKEDKLRNQFDSTKNIASEIFSGVCIHVNGLTRPPLSVLRSLILEHGGAFEQYYHRDRVTHFVCTHVAKSKLENFIKRSHGKIKVMKPEWITDSIKAGKLLDEFVYRNYLVEDPKQNSLHQFFEKKLDEDDNNNDCERIIKDIEFVDPEALDYNQGESNINLFELDLDLDQDHDDISLLADLIESSECDIPEEDANNVFSATNFEKSKTSPESKTSAHPEFLNEYYKNSRLHHLSTWREELKMFAANLMKKKLRNSITIVKNLATKVIMHIDLDCFFVSVSLLKHPDKVSLKGKPIAVTHAKNENYNISDSSADISSCNYEARAFGIRNDMYIRQALKLCPDLKMIPYDFEGYNHASKLFYEILANWADELQAVSCDEAFIDLTSCELDPEIAAEEIRKEIREKCKIDASIGIGPNLIIARLATKKAKPNGCFRVKPEDVDQFMSLQKLEDLPGFGEALLEKLPASIKTCADALDMPLSELQNRLGNRQGLNLFRKIRGEDDRTVGTQIDRKSVGSEVSWGIRFASTGQCRRFLDELGTEVWQRMSEAFPGILEPKPRRIQIKLYRRQVGAGQSKKHLGRGICDTFHRSKTFQKGLTKESLFLDEVWQLFDSEFLKGLATAVEDIRGIGVFLNEFACNYRSFHKDISELFSEVSTNSTSKANNISNTDFWVTASQVDSNAWLELPEEIQREYEEEWKKRKAFSNITEDIGSNIKASSKLNKDHKNIKAAKKSSVTLTQMWGHREQRESAQLLKEISELPSDLYDKQVVLALPFELQKEIIEQWKTEKIRSEIRPNDSYLIKVDRMETSIDPQKIIRVTECLPVEFKGRKDWTPEKIYAFILNNRNSNDSKNIHEIEELLIELVLHQCLKPVSDACGLLKDAIHFSDLLEKLKCLVSELFEGSYLKF